MNNQIESSLRNIRKLRESSIKTYRSTFGKIAKQFDVEFLSQEWLKQNADKVLNWVATQKHGSKVAIYSSLLVLLSPSKKKQATEGFVELYEKINVLLKKENNAYQDIKANQQKTQVESDNWINFNQIKKFHNKWQKITLANVKLKGVTYEFQRFLILSLYIALPPRRLDYAGVEIVTELEYFKLPIQTKRKNNFLVISGGKRKRYYFSWGGDASKSAFKEEALIVNTPANLTRFIKLWLSYNKTQFFLITPKMIPMSKNQLSKTITGIFVEHFNKRISCSMLRKIFLSHLYKDNVKYKMSIQISKLMNHTVSTQMINYVKH